jgi:hypothetical protein
MAIENLRMKIDYIEGLIPNRNLILQNDLFMEDTREILGLVTWADGKMDQIKHQMQERYEDNVEKVFGEFSKNNGIGWTASAFNNTASFNLYVRFFDDVLKESVGIDDETLALASMLTTYYSTVGIEIDFTNRIVSQRGEWNTRYLRDKLAGRAEGHRMELEGWVRYDRRRSSLFYRWMNRKQEDNSLERKQKIDSHQKDQDIFNILLADNGEELTEYFKACKEKMDVYCRELVAISEQFIGKTFNLQLL